ncbi:transcription initiation factor IIE subunit beta-like [Silene latifolia]|uniref:transcription initiation factor IIE subunit beta-like n=1 Tax=Silene latifolia TaxID=37657 RepID=UPI003D777F1D
MSLRDDLARFQKQQERCQTTLSKYSARQAPAKASTSQNTHSTMRKETPPIVPLANMGISTPVGKFSENTEKLQQINNIRKAPVGAQMKKVIELLEKTRRAFTADEINKACYVDMNTNKEVFDSLTKNVKVKYDGLRFSYKSKYEIKDKDNLLQTIERYQEGIAIFDLKDSYLDVMKDLQTLKAEGKIWLLSNFDSKEDIAYPNDPRLSSFKVDDDLKQLFRGIDLPQDFLDVEKDLRQRGLTPATDTTKRKEAAQVQGVSSKPKGPKRKEITKRTKLTNAHLPELFEKPKPGRPS